MDKNLGHCTLSLGNVANGLVAHGEEDGATATEAGVGVQVGAADVCRGDSDDGIRLALDRWHWEILDGRVVRSPAKENPP
ncbi:hypothetical protein CTA1_6104 [Colletotrichum tanaceti]|uniref:Uncharacterized protein n=1 Tax=Colletotrichum tanaceti TaxID=1306861 RepID=A0A4U6XCU4_9PEZI|nr:hypothetical protein CTA1_6104 [Colletotrichum tanaceti]